MSKQDFILPAAILAAVLALVAAPKLAHGWQKAGALPGEFEETNDRCAPPPVMADVPLPPHSAQAQRLHDACMVAAGWRKI